MSDKFRAGILAAADDLSETAIREERPSLLWWAETLREGVARLEAKDAKATKPKETQP